MSELSKEHWPGGADEFNVYFTQDTRLPQPLPSREITIKISDATQLVTNEFDEQGNRRILSHQEYLEVLGNRNKLPLQEYLTALSRRAIETASKENQL